MLPSGSMMQVKWRQWHPTPVLLPGKSYGRRSLVGCSPWGRWGSDTTEWLHFHFHALEKEMETHSSVLAWRIPGMGEPGGLPSMGSHRVRHDWSGLVAGSIPGCFCWDFFPELPDSHKGTFICGWLSKPVFFGENTVENSYSTILLTVTVLTQGSMSSFWSSVLI